MIMIIRIVKLASVFIQSKLKTYPKQEYPELFAIFLQPIIQR